MTSAQRQTLHTLLEKLKRELEAKAARRPEPTRTDDAEVGADEDEQPLNEMNQAIASNRNKSDAQLAVRVSAALLRLAKTPDEFGLCRDCEEAIPFPRLKAMPYAELCVDCQQKKDPPRGAARKSLTDYVE